MNDIFNLRIDVDLDFPVRVTRVLYRVGITHVRDLVVKTPKYLLSLDGFGLRSLQNTVDTLRQHGLKLGMTELVVPKPEQKLLRIAVDYDDTYTADPELWDAFVGHAKERGHDVRIVTVRDDRKDWTPAMLEVEKNYDVIFTRGVAKAWFCARELDWEPNIWIDDRPKTILNNSEFTNPQLLEWRQVRQ